MYLATIIFEVWFHHQRNSHVVFKECLEKKRNPHFRGLIKDHLPNACKLTVRLSIQIHVLLQ